MVMFHMEQGEIKKMNYTKPNDEEHNDNPNDWLSSALIFAGALGSLLKEDEGVVVKIRGDMNLGFPGILDSGVNTVIVYNKDNQIRIDSTNSKYLNGQMVWYHDDEMNDFSDFKPDRKI